MKKFVAMILALVMMTMTVAFAATEIVNIDGNTIRVYTIDEKTFPKYGVKIRVAEYHVDGNGIGTNPKIETIKLKSSTEYLMYLSQEGLLNSIASGATTKTN